MWVSQGCRGRFRCAGGDAFECGTPPGSEKYYCDCGGARVDPALLREALGAAETEAGAEPSPR